MNIAVIGLGYVGLSLAVLLAQENEVSAVDVKAEVLDALRQKNSPVNDPLLGQYLKTKPLKLFVTESLEQACAAADCVILALPTDFDEAKNAFDTSVVDCAVMEVTRLRPEALIVIKSTIPIGHTRYLREKSNNPNIVFSPEFLREGYTLYDNLHPTRIIVGADKQDAYVYSRSAEFLALLKGISLDEDVEAMLVGSDEAEAIKLFSNTYLALRVAFFNELDSYALKMGYSASEIIGGMCLDKRIGAYYNNPSFGYGGYCLPKDAKQLAAQLEAAPGVIIKSISQSNALRKSCIAEEVLARLGYDFKAKAWPAHSRPTVGVYRLCMKSGSDNYRQSSVLDVLEHLREAGCEILIYEPLLRDELLGYHSCRELESFKRQSDLIIANRPDADLADVTGKLFTRDIYGRE